MQNPEHIHEKLTVQTTNVFGFKVFSFKYWG